MRALAWRRLAFTIGGVVFLAACGSSSPVSASRSTSTVVTTTIAVTTTSRAPLPKPRLVTAPLFQRSLVTKAKLSAAQAKCVADAVFTQMRQTQIDQLYYAQSTSELGPGIQSEFTSILQTCIRGGHPASTTTAP